MHIVQIYRFGDIAVGWPSCVFPMYVSIRFHSVFSVSLSDFCWICILLVLQIMFNKLPRTPIYQLHDTGLTVSLTHDDVIKWKRFPRYWPFVRGIRRSPVNSPHKGQWRGALMFSLICAWLNAWVNSRKAGDLRRHRAHYDVIVIFGENRCTIGRVNCYVILLVFIYFWPHKARFT